jgi:1-deoxy-D-xylulose-5-phosphate synthase
MKIESYSLLEKINSPKDIKGLNEAELIQLALQLRTFIIHSLSDNPGHLGASLGTVELTIALHFVFNAPLDKLIWDVGHQAYGHKILCGRRSLFHTNRKFKGISGFPSRFESPFDAFGVGHSSTSISAALGMAIAAKIQHLDNQQVVAIIGDGAMTGGMAFEALNHGGTLKSNLLVVLNDNNMAIDANVGSLSTNNKLIDALNFQYFGPIDGHNLPLLIQTLNDIRNLQGPKLLHIRTTKGKGFRQAELNQTEWHYAPGKYNTTTGELLDQEAKSATPIRFQDVFGYTLLELANENPAIVGITPAMPTGSSMNIMMDEMPSRVFDVGIAEQHAVTFAAGMAAQGLTPFCNIYSTFMQRAYDQVIHDTALQRLPVVFCLDRAGLVGADGATHHGAFDLAYFRAIPNLIIAAPRDEHELRNLMYSAQLQRNNPYVIRYPRGKGSLHEWKNEFKEIKTGTGIQLLSGKNIAILCVGPVNYTAIQAAESMQNELGFRPAVFDLCFVKPLDENLLHKLFASFSGVITIEDGVIHGGFGSAVLEFAADNRYKLPISRLGIPDEFIEHGSPAELWAYCGYDLDGICNSIKAMWEAIR